MQNVQCNITLMHISIFAGHIFCKCSLAIWRRKQEAQGLVPPNATDGRLGLPNNKG